MNSKRWYLPITVVFLFLGIMLSLQFQAQTRAASDLTQQRTETLITMVRALSEKRQKLALEIIDLGNQLRSQMESSQDEQKMLQSICQETEKLNIVNGATEQKGSGLTITIEDYMPIVYTDLLNIVNELWNAGAEAIAINEHRITQHTTISYTETHAPTEWDPAFDDYYVMFMTVNHQIIEYPITISAIGDPNNLEKGLTLPGGIMDNLALFNAYPLINKEEKLTIPAVEKPHTHYFVKEYNPETNSPKNGNEPAAKQKRP